MLSILNKLARNPYMYGVVRSRLIRSTLHTSQSYLSLKFRKANSFSDIEFAFKIARQENWGMALGDKECYFAADPEGFFIGELNGKKVCSLSMIKYPRSKLAVMGFGITVPEYRERGYLREIAKHVRQSAPEEYCIQGDALKYLIPFLQNEIGLRNFGWVNLCSIVNSKNAVDLLKTYGNNSSISLRPAVEIDCEQLSNYEEDVIRIYRKSFLQKWISFPGRKGWVALNAKGTIVGFVVSREILQPKHTHKVAPLYADTPEVACCLLNQISKEIFTENELNKMYFDIPIGNRYAVQLIKNAMGARVLWELTRVSTKEPLQKCINRIYAIASNTAG